MGPALLAALLAAGGAAGAAHAASSRIELIACAPGYPGTSAEAQPNMDTFAAAVARAAGLPAGAVVATYEPSEEEGLARLASPDAAVALVPLPFLVKHSKALKLAPRLQVETQGVGLTEVWTLVAKKGRVTSPDSLAGFTVQSIAGYAPEFVRAALADWGKLPPSAKVVQSSQVLSALRKAVAGADLAVLLDGAQSTAFAGLPFASDLEVVARSKPLPSAFVATVGDRLPAARWEKLEKAMLGLTSDPQGAAALQGIRMTRFVPVDPGAVTTTRRLLAESGR
jgi:hypothetical protein